MVGAPIIAVAPVLISAGLKADLTLLLFFSLHAVRVSKAHSDSSDVGVSFRIGDVIVVLAYASARAV